MLPLKDLNDQRDRKGQLLRVRKFLDVFKFLSNFGKALVLGGEVGEVKKESMISLEQGQIIGIGSILY